jgi:hypothetical protein
MVLFGGINLSFSALTRSIEKACSVSNNEGAFSMAVVAAFSKSIGLVSEIDKNLLDNKYYWIAPALRSVCEDLIVLGFLDKNLKNQSDEIIKIQLSIDTHKSLLAQEALFSKYRPHQPRIKPSTNTSRIEESEKRLKEIFGPFTRGGNRNQPSVRQMAKNQGMLLLYEFLYHATSRLVHFSPNTLLRMAWFDPKVQVSHCDPSALDKYYYHFIRFYSAHLLSAFVKRFSEKIDMSEELSEAIEENLADVNRNPRWPELVTFEELNADNPWQNEDAMKKMSFWNILIEDPGVVFEPKL